MASNYSTKLVAGIAALNLILVGALFYWFAFRGNPANEIDQRCNTKILESELLGQPLPKYQFADRDGADVYQNLTRGKILIVVFLTHCPACVAEFKMLEQHSAEIGANFKVVAITSESGGIVEQFMDTRKPAFPVYLDVRGSLMLEARVSCTPTLLFLDDGIVQKIKIGKADNYEEIVEGFQS